jgi:4-amino-4-deoxy-L-arabinose transferase-like glycosyltransferase
MSTMGSVGIMPGVASASQSVLRSTSMWLEERIDRSPSQAFALLSVFYFVVVFALSSLKLLWLDELITLHIARLGSPSAIWHALALGADPNPMVTYLLVDFCRHVFGDHEFAYRLPAMVGYWIGLLSLFLYLKNRLPALWAVAGAVLSMTMAAFDYSYESRSYGIFYGFAMLAFLCWSRAVDRSLTVNARRLALVGMVFALAAGISTNYFAVLAFFPIAAGEVVRTVVRARKTTRLSRDQDFAPGSLVSRWPALHAPVLGTIDMRIWLGLAIAATPLLAYRPLIARSIAQFAPYAWNKVSLQQVADSYTQMVEIVLYPILALFAIAIIAYFVSRRIALLCTECRAVLLPTWVVSLFDREPLRFAIPAHEATGIFFLMLYPFLGYVIASIRGGMLSPRFVIPVCFGFAIAATLIAYQLFGNLRRAGLIFLCFVLAWFVCRESVVGYWYEEQKQCFYKVLDHLPEAESAVSQDAPIVIPDPLLVLTFQHYAPAAIASRVVFPLDFPAIRFYRHDDSPEENLWAGRNLIYTVPITLLAPFQNSVANYLIIASDGNWLLEDLGHHRYPVVRLPIDTRAQAIGGFTPLARGTPTFYTAIGEGATPYILTPSAMPVPFRTEDNLREVTDFLPDGVQQ